MINTRELIGNYFTVAHESNSPIIKVKSFHDGMVYDENGKKFELALILPILLTEKWLKRFQFKKLEKKVFSKKIDLNFSLFINIDDDLCLIGYHNTDKNDIQLINIEYIHQLQILYFALTGKELEIK